MSEYHFPVPGSIDEDKIVLFIRKHWAAFLGQGILIAFLIIFPIILFTVLYTRDHTLFEGLFRNFLVLGMSAYYLIIVTFSFTAWMSFYFDIYIVMTDSIVDVRQLGFFGRKISQLSLLRVQDTSSDIEGFFPTFFGYGNVLVETAGEQTQNFLLESVPNPQEISAKIQELHNQLVEIEGRHHQLLEGEGRLAPGRISETGGHEHPEQMTQNTPPSLSAENPTRDILPIQEQTPYQELLEKEKTAASSQIRQVEEPQPTESIQPSDDQEGEVTHDDLDKGGEIKL